MLQASLQQGHLGMGAEGHHLVLFAVLVQGFKVFEATTLFFLFSVLRENSCRS